jgi:glucoamylase
LEIWKFNRQVRSIPAGGVLRIQAASAFRLRWTSDGWKQAHDTASTSIGTGHEYVDIRIEPGQTAPFCFTFFWTIAKRWEGRNFQVDIVSGSRSALPYDIHSQEVEENEALSTSRIAKGAVLENSGG